MEKGCPPGFGSMAVDHDAGHKNKKKMPGVVSKGGKHRGGSKNRK